MPNSETDALNLVETTTVRGGNWLFPRNVGVNTGFSQQVFRASGEYLGSADDYGDRVRARDGDLVLRVSLGDFALAFAGELATKDHHTRAYQAEMILRVSDPVQFAISYRQQVDPVARARKTIDGNLATWAAGMRHDDITINMLRFRIEHALVAVSRSIGLSVVSADKVTLRLGAMDAQIIQIQQDHTVHQAQHTVDVEIKQEDREEAARDHAAQLRETALEQDAALTQEFRQATLRTLQGNLLKQLNDLLKQGYSLDEISEQHPRLLRDLGQLGGLQGMDLLPSGNPEAQESGKPSGIYGTTASEVNEGERIEPIGGWVKAVELADNQRRVVVEQGYEIHQVFQIARLDEGGPAANANLAMGDILLQVNTLALDDVAALRMLLSPNTGLRMQAQIAIIRDEQVYVANVEIAA